MASAGFSHRADDDALRGARGADGARVTLRRTGLFATSKSAGALPEAKPKSPRKKGRAAPTGAPSVPLYSPRAPRQVTPGARVPQNFAAAFPNQTAGRNSQAQAQALRRAAREAPRALAAVAAADSASHQPSVRTSVLARDIQALQRQMELLQTSQAASNGAVLGAPSGRKHARGKAGKPKRRASRVGCYLGCWLPSSTASDDEAPDGASPEHAPQAVVLAAPAPLAAAIADDPQPPPRLVPVAATAAPPPAPPPPPPAAIARAVAAAPPAAAARTAAPPPPPPPPPAPRAAAPAPPVNPRDALMAELRRRSQQPLRRTNLKRSPGGTPLPGQSAYPSPPQMPSFSSSEHDASAVPPSIAEEPHGGQESTAETDTAVQLSTTEMYVVAETGEEVVTGAGTVVPSSTVTAEDDVDIGSVSRPPADLLHPEVVDDSPSIGSPQRDVSSRSSLSTGSFGEWVSALPTRSLDFGSDANIAAAAALSSSALRDRTNNVPDSPGAGLKVLREASARVASLERGLVHELPDRVTPLARWPPPKPRPPTRHPA